MSYMRPLLPFLCGWILILSSSTFSAIGLVNGLLQLLLFAFVVCLPIWRTGRMNYVDIGWPWGLVILGFVSYWLSDGYWLRSLTISLVIILVGLRMGVGALKMWHLGLLRSEFPRYQYQHVRWQKEGKTDTALALQVEALLQGLANASFLALPIFIIATNDAPTFALLEIIGLGLWLLAFAMESLADLQKINFLREMKKAGEKRRVCDVGLWRYCRHPNYFFEWMVWNGLIIAAIPSWAALQSNETIVVWLLLGVGLLLASGFMYRTLVYTTGAIPSEYYSMEKRPDYKAYQARTNRFFPGPVRNVD
jgi:steroid 5-alpha reductase family enzyme